MNNKDLYKTLNNSFKFIHLNSNDDITPELFNLICDKLPDDIIDNIIELSNNKPKLLSIIINKRMISENILEKYIEYINDWRTILYKQPNISETFLQKYINIIKCDNIIEYRKVSSEFIVKNINFINDYKNIFIYQNVNDDLIIDTLLNYINEEDYLNIISHCKLSEEILEKICPKFNYKYIWLYQDLSEEFILKHIDVCDFSQIAKTQILSIPFIKKYISNLNIIYIQFYQKLNEDFIEYLIETRQCNFEVISESQKLSENFIKKHIIEFSNEELKNIIKYQKLSEEFLDYLYNTIDINNELELCIVKYQNVSIDFIKSHNICLRLSQYAIINYNNIGIENYDGDNWLYKDTNFKKEQIIKSGLYECYDDYFIAYKAIRKDRYSLYNFQYKYDPNKTYESKCDCTYSENSFGLNVGTYAHAKTYSIQNSIIVKCKVRYEDVGRLVHDNNKIRCFKIEILN